MLQCLYARIFCVKVHAAVDSAPPTPNYPLLDLGTLNWLLLEIKSEQTLCAYYEEINYGAYSFQPCPKQTYSQLGISLS